MWATGWWNRRQSMKHNRDFFMQYAPWLLLLLIVDGLGALLLWLSDVRAFAALVTVILLASLILFAAVFLVTVRLERKKEQAFADFLADPDLRHEEALLKLTGWAQAASIRLLGNVLREKQEDCDRIRNSLTDYEEYVESWAHEAKTPISLLTFLLDNHREELSENTGFKLDFIRNRMQEIIDQMLYYARVKGPQKDYLFEPVNPGDCVWEVLEDYRPLLEEKEFQVFVDIPASLKERCYTDRRGLRFILNQIISKSIKYSGSEPEIHVEWSCGNQEYVLLVQDNGIGVRPGDLPYIFQKGFTGDSGGERKKATGMGLYLASELARDLNLTLEAESEWGKGFEMRIRFPVVERL